MTISVRFLQETPSGLATMLGELIEQNLAREPARERLLVPSVSSIEASDAGVAVTIAIAPPLVTIAGGVDRSATVRVRAPSDRLLALVSVPLRFGLPDVLRAQGRSVVADVMLRRVGIRGLLRHPRQVARLTMLLSVLEDHR